MTRRGLFALFLLVLFAPFGVRGLLGLQEHEGSGSERRVRLELRIITPHTQDIQRTFDRAFSDWHEQNFGEPVRVVYLTPRGTSDMVRYLRDVAGQHGLVSNDATPSYLGVDVVFGGGDVTVQREILNLLAPLKLPPGVLAAAFPEPDLNGVPLYERVKGDAPPRWVGVVLASFGIAYNPELYAALGLPAPQTWSDLTRPELADLVALADPTRSGSAAVAYMMVVQRAMADREARFLSAHGGVLPALGQRAEYDAAIAQGYHDGLGLLLRIAANARYFTDSGSRPCDDVGNAEAGSAMAIDFYARMMSEELGDNRVSYVAPYAATAITPDPVAVLKGVSGERELLANRFVEFLLTPEAQRLWSLKSNASPYVMRSLRRLPIRPDVYADRKDWADDVDPFAAAGGFNLRGEWMNLFRDTREVWAAAWIDSAASLKSAYHAALGVRGAAERAALLRELADLPIQMQEVAAHKRERERLEATRTLDPQLANSRQRLEWAQRFRAHYGKVEERAHALSAH
jgi:ABC-type Fe3+ transport system substrate-binding protein